MEDVIQIEPCGGVSGTVRVPGDKSISHRLAMMSGLAAGESVIHGFLCSEDCLNTLRAVEALGAGFASEGSTVRVQGTGGPFAKPDHVLDLGNSGTGLRLLSGLLAGHPFVSELTGDRSLRSRPMQRIREPLEMMGARVDLLGEAGRPPVRIRGGRLQGIQYTMPVASAQVKSCVLLAGLFAKGATSVEEPRATRDHTERLLRALGLPVSLDGPRRTVAGEGPDGPFYAGREWTVPGDFSSAAYWIAAACREGSDVRIEGVGLNPTRTAFLSVLERMGGRLTVAPDDNAPGDGWEPAGSVTVCGGALAGTEVAGEEVPNLIDELPLVAVMGALAGGTTTIRDAAELRVKESDRIVATVEGLRAMGVQVEELDDGLVVEGGSPIRGGCDVDSRGDHRIAMAMAVLALFADAPTRIHHVACVETSYPGFWECLADLTTG